MAAGADREVRQDTTGDEHYIGGEPMGDRERTVGVKSLVKHILTEKENRRYESSLASVKVSYGEWLAAQEKMWRNPDTGTETEAPVCGKHEDAGIVIIRPEEGNFGTEAPERIGRYFAEHPGVMMLYGDEDVEDGGKGVFSHPWFKPDWSPHLLDSFFYFGSIVALRKDLSDRAVQAWKDSGFGDWPLQSLPMDGAEGICLCQVRDMEEYEKWIHLCVKLAGGYERGCRAIGHMSEILFHCGSLRQQEEYLKPSSYLRECGEHRRKAFRNKNEISAGAENAHPLISVIIPTKDHPKILEKCIRSVERAALSEDGYKVTYEILLVDNGSSEQNRKRVEELTASYGGAGTGKITYLYRPMEFNFSRMCNLGAGEAKGELLFFLNDDVELVLPGCMEEMAGTASREYTGAVGLKLYYPDSRRIQHVGITNLPMGPVHKLQFLEDNRPFYYGMGAGHRDVLAVTAACLMTEKNKFSEAGGFAEELQVAFNDVDLCFGLYELGYSNVCRNDLYAFHHESLSRGDDDSPEKLERLLRERDRLYERHPALEGRDPYYSCHLGREGLDTGIRPGYVTAGNRLQEIERPVSHRSVEDFRGDDCLMVRVEDCRQRELSGYGVVLGDNNACYRMEILFKAEENRDERSGKDSSGTERAGSGERALGEIYSVEVKGMYRPDLEGNMPDQVNVALCGFRVRLGENVVPAGRYRIGMAAVNRVTGLKLINWSNRFAEL